MVDIATCNPESWREKDSDSSQTGMEMFLDYTNIGGDKIFKYQTKKPGRGNCPINCGGTVTVKEGPYAVEGRKLKCEILASLGAMCLNSNGEFIMDAFGFH